MRTIHFITGNQDKFNEVKQILGNLINLKMLSVDLVEIQEVNPKLVLEKKLELAKQIYPDKTILVEDTSLVFNCIKPLPGPLIKWFEKSMSYEDLHALCKKYDNFSSIATVTLGLNIDNKNHFFEGTIKGTIEKPVGKSFGWDVIFKPDNYEKRFSEMTSEEKNKISMRRLALNKLMDFLEKQDN